MDRSVESESEIQTDSKFSNLVHQLRQFLEDNHHLKIPSECVPYLCRCLKQKDENVKETVKLILAFQKGLKVFVSDWNCTLQPRKYCDLYIRENGFFNPLSQRDDHGRRVFLLRPAMWDPKEVSHSEFTTCYWMFLQYVNAYVEDVQEFGYVIIWDFNNLSVEQGLAMSPSTALAMLRWEQNETCGKMVAGHAVNHPRVIDVIYAGCKPFLNDKIKKRIFFHKSMDNLLDFVPARILPPYLNGTAKEDSYVDKTLLYELILHDKFFEDMVNHGFPTK